MIEQKPKRPYKNFEEYLSKQRNFSSRELLYPCYRCCGTGRIIDPSETPDVIEGHKLSRRINCPMCEGTREVDRSLHMVRYRKHTREWKVEYAEWKAWDKARRIALRKLTKADREVLGVS